MRYTLSERAVTAADAAGLALYRTQDAGGTVHILYDPQAALKLAQQDLLAADLAQQQVDELFVGLIFTTPHESDCNGADEVLASAARRGYGPLMYDIAMGASREGITSDKHVGTSQAAQRVWQYYARSRPDVAVRPMDDAADPHTPDPRDDCRVFGNEYLDASYDGPGAGAARVRLLSNHERALARLERMGCEPDELEAALVDNMDDFFGRKYNGEH